MVLPLQSTTCFSSSNLGEDRYDETDTYLSIDGPALGIYKDKGSKFNAYVFPIQNEGSFKDQLQLIKLKRLMRATTVGHSY